MKVVIKSNERGLADHGWLKSRHTFSFADYYNPNRMGFSVLRVINEDQIEGGTGFGTHPHRDMEIISYVIDGALKHQDSMGTEAIIYPGEIQRMSAGTGIRHSEYNHLENKKTHFLQIWILPEKNGLAPSYGQKSFAEALTSSELVLVASKTGKDGSVALNQDINLYACKAAKSGEKKMTLDSQRAFWLQVIKGQVLVDDISLVAGDGLGLEKEPLAHLQWSQDSEFLLFDLPH